MIRSESISKIAAALVAAQKEMGAATKDSKNPYFKSSYADLSAVIEAAVPVLNSKGIAVLQNPTVVHTAAGAKTVLETVLLHESGEFMGSQIDIVTAKENDPQAYGSAISYARRYGLQSTVTLKAADDDGELSMGRGNTNKTPADTKVLKVEDKTQVKEENKVATLSEEVSKKKVSFSKKSFAKPETTTSSSDSEL